MQFKVADLQTFEAYKKAMRSAASQIGKESPFCIFSDVQILDASKKLRTLKPFLVVGGGPTVITPLLKDLKGSKRLTASGVCSLDDGKVRFHAKSGSIDQLKSQASLIKDLLGKEMCHGDPEPDEAAPAAHAKPPGSPAPPAGSKAPPSSDSKKLKDAAEHWKGVRIIVDSRVDKLKQSVKAHYAKSHPNVLKEIDRNLQKIDAVVGKFDHKLSDALHACAAAPEKSRAAEVRKAESILKEFRRVVETEDLIAHLDHNPFGVKPEIEKTITDSLDRVERAIA